MVSTGRVGGIRGSGILSSVADVRGMRGVGGVCGHVYVFGSVRCGRRVGGWMRGLGLGFTNPVGTGGVLDVCLGCGGVAGKWVEGLDQGL